MLSAARGGPHRLRAALAGPRLPLSAAPPPPAPLPGPCPVPGPVPRCPRSAKFTGDAIFISRADKTPGGDFPGTNARRCAGEPERGRPGTPPGPRGRQVRRDPSEGWAAPGEEGREGRAETQRELVLRPGELITAGLLRGSRPGDRSCCRCRCCCCPCSCCYSYSFLLLLQLLLLFLLLFLPRFLMLLLLPFLLLLQQFPLCPGQREPPGSSGKSLEGGGEGPPVLPPPLLPNSHSWAQVREKLLLLPAALGAGPSHAPVSQVPCSAPVLLRVSPPAPEPQLGTQKDLNPSKSRLSAEQLAQGEVGKAQGEESG